MSFHTTLCRIVGGTLGGLFCAALAVAQVHHNEVIRFGTIDLVQAQTNLSTGYNLEMPGAQPAAYMAASTIGVSAGTVTWIWYPSQCNTRYEDRYITGHMVAVRPSTATPSAAYSIVHPGQSAAGVPIYIPKFAVYAPKLRPVGVSHPHGRGYDPDFSKQPLLTYNTVHTPLVQPMQADQALVWTVTYNQRFKLAENEVVFGFEWQGGEHASKSLSQSLPTGWSESHFAPSHWGWASPAPARSITRFDPTKIMPPPSTMNVYTSPMGGYFEDQATISLHSDWGEKRDPQLAGTVYPSYNVGSGLSDLASTAGAFGWDVFAHQVNQGQRAMPLLNLRTAPYPSASQMLGQTFELDPFDLGLALMWGNPLVDGFINSYGLFLPVSRLSYPALGPSALGIWVGMEFALVEVLSGDVSETTQALWFYVEK